MSYSNRQQRNNNVINRHCRYCHDKEASLNYKDAQNLSQYITERGKIIPSRITGNCAYHQRLLQSEVKRARAVALLPFSSNHQ